MSNVNPCIYLAGPISGLSYEETVTWRINFPQMLLKSIRCVSPMRDKNELKDDPKLGFGYDHFLMCSNNAIVQRDRYDARQCDGIVAYFPDGNLLSIGTLLELGIAMSTGDKLVIVVCPDGKIREHELVKGWSSYVVDTLEKAAVILNSTFAPYIGMGNNHERSSRLNRPELRSDQQDYVRWAEPFDGDGPDVAQAPQLPTRSPRTTGGLRAAILTSPPQPAGQYAWAPTARTPTVDEIEQELQYTAAPGR